MVLVPAVWYGGVSVSCLIILYYIVLCGLVVFSVVSRCVSIVLYYYCIVWSCCLQGSMEGCLYRAVFHCITLCFVILLPLVLRSVCIVPYYAASNCVVWSFCL